MKRLVLLSVFILACAATVAAQSSTTTQNARRLPNGSGAPTGSCVAGPPFIQTYIDSSTTPPTTYYCKAGTWTASSGGTTAAPKDATYIVETLNPTLTNEFALGSLATGILKNTTTTGVPSIAAAGDFPTLNQNTSGTAAGLSATLAATSGGTGQSTYTKGDLLASPGSNTLNKLAVGTDGQVLTADAASTNGVKWAAAGGGGANTVTTSLLLSSTSVNLNEGTGAKQTLYTCPASRRCIITNIVMQKFSAVPSVVVTRAGWDAAASNVILGFALADWVTSTTQEAVLGNFTNAASSSVFLSNAEVGAAADVFGMQVQTPEGSALTAKVDVYGYLTDTNGVPVANVNGTGDAAAVAPASVTTTGGVGVGVAAPASGLALDKTVTAGGTAGAQTINKPSGTVNFAAAATSLVVTNSLVATSSIIQCTVGTNDTTMKSVQCVAGSGSFTIFPNAAPTAETRVNFTLTN